VRRWWFANFIVLTVVGLMATPLRSAGGASEAPVVAGDEVTPVEVPVRKVVLFSSGVGYCEHLGSVTGNGHTELRFRTGQINDILKSLLLQDLDGGQVESVVYPAQDPLAKTLSSFQVDLSGNPSLAELLQQLRGSTIQVTMQGEQIVGTIVGLEKRRRLTNDKDGLAEVWMLNLMAGGSLRALPLDEVQRLELQDGRLQQELHKALQALARARDQAKKPVVIAFRGEGERRVRLGYVIETPIWKASYRLILPEHPSEPAHLQGWAIVENQTDSDWHDVELSVVSGRPISFVQDLYAPLYVPRPVVKPELYTRLQPQTYEAGAAPPAQQARGPIPAAPPKAEARALTTPTPRPEPEASLREAPLDPTASVSAAAASGELGELFHYTISHVSLPRQRSAMLPIVADALEGERVSIYNQGVLANHPLTGVRLRNTTGKHLPQGPITVLDANAYAGDARIDNLPPGQERLISYAVDLQVAVHAATRREESALQTGKIVKGVLQLTRKQALRQEYVIENRAGRDRVVLIEHPFQKGWHLVEPSTPQEITDALYRFRATVAAGKTLTLAVQEEKVQSETIAMLPADLGQLESYSRRGEIPQDVREALTKAMGLKSALIDTQRQIHDKQQALADLTQEQQRLRDNMGAVSPTSQYYTRLLTKLNDQETRIEQLQAELERLKRAYEQQRKELETYLMNTTVG
jgi:HAMP domain-containing protein